MSLEAEPKGPSTLQIFTSSPSEQSLSLVRNPSSAKSLQGKGIKGLLCAIETKTKQPILRQSMRNATKTITSTSPDELSPKELQSAAYNTDCNKKPSELSLREKRLNDMESYRMRCERSSSSLKEAPPISNKSNFSCSLVKSPSCGTQTFSLSRNRKRGKITFSPLIAPYSPPFTLANIPKEQDSPTRGAGNNSPFFLDTTPSRRIQTQEEESQRSNSQMLELKLLTDSNTERLSPLTEKSSMQKRSMSTTHLRKKAKFGDLSPISKRGKNSMVFFSKGSIAQSTLNGFTNFTEGSLLDSKRMDSKPELRASPDEWQNYAQKAQRPMPRLKSRPRIEREPSVVESRGQLDQSVSNRTEIIIKTMKPVYSNFVLENFDDRAIERLNTLNVFGFTHNEKNDNQEISTFFNSLNSGRDITGTMGLVDLWSLKMRKNVAKHAEFVQEKEMIERFIHQQKNSRKKETVKQPRAKDEADKHKLALRNLAESAEKNQKLAFVSPMRRHLLLRGKTFYEPTEVIAEKQEEKFNADRFNQELGVFMENLKDFKDQNEEDYLKLMKFRKESKEKGVMTKAKFEKEITKLKDLLPRNLLAKRKIF